MIKDKKTPTKNYQLEKIGINKIVRYRKLKDRIVVPVNMKIKNDVLCYRMIYEWKNDELRCFFVDVAGYEPFPKEQEVLLRTYQEDVKFQWHRDAVERKIKEESIKKPIHDVEILSHQLIRGMFKDSDIERIEVFLKIQLEGDQATECRMIFDLNQNDKHELHGMDIPYFGFTHDLADKVKEKMRLLFLMVDGE